MNIKYILDCITDLAVIIAFIIGWKALLYKGDEYKNAVVECLKRMSRANIPFDDFRKCLEGLVEYHIITDEMADKFAEYRRKYQKEQ